MKGILWRGLLPLILLSPVACTDGPTGPGRLDSLRLDPGSPIITVGDTTLVRVSGTVPGGQLAAPKIRLRSLDPGIAMVNGSGVVVGVSQGVARITGEAGGTVDTAQVTVIPGRYNVQTGDGKQCSAADYRTGRVMAVGDHSIVVADPANPSGGFTAADYQDLARTFDQVIHPIITDFFGTPADIDGNGRVLIFYTRAVNEMTPAGSAGYVGGFFHTRDLFPKTSRGGLQGCSTSNEAEMFYLMVPDPTGAVNGNRRDKEMVRQATLGTIAHEYQHLINASRRLFINKAPDFEETWLNEGLSHIAEELIFYHSSGLSARQNLNANQLRASKTRVDAFNAYQIFNFGRLDWYFKNTETHAAHSDSARLGDRGAVWHFLRYLADRTGLSERDLWFRLANSMTTGFANLQQVIGQDPLPLYRDWAVTAYTDDLVSTTDSIFQQPSWNHQSVMPSINLSPLLPNSLKVGTPQRVTLTGGGTSYLRFGVAPGQVAELRVAPASAGTPTAGGCPPSQPRLNLQVGEVHTSGTASADNTICVAGGITGGEFVIITTNAATAANSTAVNITGFGIRTTSGLSPLVAANHSPAAAAVLAPTGALALDYSIDTRIRRLERTALAELRGRAGARRSRASLQALPGAGATFYVSVVRMK